MSDAIRSRERRVATIKLIKRP